MPRPQSRREPCYRRSLRPCLGTSITARATKAVSPNPPGAPPPRAPPDGAAPRSLRLSPPGSRCASRARCPPARREPPRHDAARGRTQLVEPVDERRYRVGAETEDVADVERPLGPSAAGVDAGDQSVRVGDV